ncbi:hypothetical protein CSC62_00555 [Pseudoxanthomonas jiangsuensis]|uniref:hypothetical protein n=1 Tax=Pseudoxanthomonas jiangsuensis TaxID=619688 RepID=UPI0013908A0A|nr:hypothetical protein [Pseudoxanthomonas jiangsuensis]KAF1699431.1 hypothetical protein CSC62_00555 [Pseudoxanthomonas jiangsuensis]
MQPLRLSSRAVLLPTLLVLASLLCLPAARAGTLRRPAPAVELDVVDRHSGTVLPQYRHAGRTWLPGEPGHAYALRLRNTRPQRLLVVLSVDGINAIDGRTADVHQAGYVLEPWQTLEVAGWRKSLDAVAQFMFVDPGASYAARTGRPDNLGVIGIAVFAERAPHGGIARVATSGDAPRERAAAPAPVSAQAGMEAEDAVRPEAGGYSQRTLPSTRLGTGHGSIEHAPALQARFQREAGPLQVTELRYESRLGLLARGIRLDHGHPLADAPRAFPGGFVPDPPDWRD